MPGVKSEMREARVPAWLASWLQDLRHGVLLLRRDRGVSVPIVLVLALGIGGTAATFTLLQAAFLEPLPYRDSGRLVTIMENTGWTPSVSEFLEIRMRTRTLVQVAFAEYVDMQVSGNGEPARVFAARASASFLSLLGAHAAIGRTLLEEENRPGQSAAVVLSHAFWQSKAGADPGIIGRAFRLDGRPATVVGVLPAGFQFDYPTLSIPEPVDMYVSYPIEPAAVFTGGGGRGVAVRVIAALRYGITLAQAQSDIGGIARALTREHPSAYPNPEHDPSRFTFLVRPLRDAIVGRQGSLLWLLLGGSAVLLVIACANAAQLLLARSLRRGREVAIRAALGASRVRLVRQFLLEGLVLAISGGAAGLLAARWIVHAFVALLPVRSPLLASANLDARAVGFTLAASVLSSILFATLPAVKGSRRAPGPNLSAPVSTGEGSRWRQAMVAMEGALSVFLLCAAGLVAQNLRALVATPMGFDPAHVLAMRLKLPARHENAIDVRAGAVFQGYLDRIEAIPGVESAATVTGPPLRPARIGNGSLEGVTESNGEPKIVWSHSHLVSPDYFRTLRVPLLAGRGFRRGDTGRVVNVAIVNQEFARRFGLGADVIGKQFYGEPITIVGMVGNVRTRGLGTDPEPEVYLSSLQLSWANVYLVVRSALPPADLLKRVKAAIGSANSEQPVFGVETMNDMIAEAVAEPRFEVFLVGAFAVLAVAMAAAGMYSVISCMVSERSGEIAIRLALGASRGAIVRTVVGATTAWVTMGLAGGLGLGLATRNTVRTLSSAVAVGSPWMYVAVALFFLAVTLVAASAPLWRSTRIDPAAALRCE